MSWVPPWWSPTSGCPAIFFQAEDCGFIIIKTAEKRFRAKFFYAEDLEQRGTGVEEYDELGDCVVALLQTQADYQSVRSSALPTSSSN